MPNAFHNQEHKWDRLLSKITSSLYIVSVLIELVISLVMYFSGLIEQTITEYILLYVARPIIITSVIMIIGKLLLRKSLDEINRYRVYVIMITLIFGVFVYIHNVFLVASFCFCIPVALTVILQDKKLLLVVSLLSELIITLTGAYSIITKSNAVTEFYVPSILIMMTILTACSKLCEISINVLIEQRQAIMTAMEEAKSANNSKSIFLSNMSHEIRTPINAILGFDEMIIRESNEDSIVEYAQDIQSSGRTLLGIINDILDFSKIEAGKLSLILAPVDNSTMINDLVLAVSGRAYDKHLSFITDIDPNIPQKVFGDELRIKQVCVNILTNAVKYTDKGFVKMCITSEKLDDKYVNIYFSVKDSGRGMGEEDLEKLTQPFVRIDESENKGIEGTGLGMSITSNLLNMMDSSLHVTSKLQEGSTFTFAIKLEVIDWNPIGNYVETTQRNRKNGVKYKTTFKAPNAHILIVDDVKMNLKVICGLLKETGIQIDTAISGAECIEKSKQLKYDLMFIDHMMPEMDGLETIQKLVADTTSVNENTPKIALTANAISGSRQIYMDAGFDEYLTKPVDISQLEQLILKLLPDELIERI